MSNPLDDYFEKKVPVALPELRNGRNVADGYNRGVGLQFGELRSMIAADPLYKEAYKLAADRTIQIEDNRMNMYLLLKYYINRLLPGDVIEYGSYKGGSAIFMAKVCSVLYPGMKVYAFDTFAGMPETDARIDIHRAGDFKDVVYDDLEKYIASIGLTNLVLVRGMFEDTAPKIMPNLNGIRLVHIDCDIRSAVAYSYEVSLPKMVPGGYIVLDDALFSSCLGATEVVEDLMIRRDGLNSEQIFPHYVFRAPQENATR